MSKEPKYRQCVLRIQLENSYREIVECIPESYAQVGKCIMLGNEEWTVHSVHQFVTEKEIARLRKL